jgi:hypothetical protein
MFRCFRRTLRKWAFPVAGWLSAFVYLMVAGGVPVPIKATKDLSVPFPCMNSPCGCQNAHQCWTSCCCRTPAERLAWAREHGVAPPHDLVVLVDSRPVAYRAATGLIEDPSACCSAKRTCCESRIDGCCKSHAAHTKRPLRNDSVLGIRALACRGFGTHWLTAVVAVPPVAVAGDYQLAPTGIVGLPSVQFFNLASPPPVVIL